MENSNPATSQPKKSLIPLIMLICLFGLPPLLGWIYIYNPELLPTAKKNQGTLILPPPAVTELKLNDASGKPFDWSQLTNKWTMVVIHQGQCEETCDNQIDILTQIKRAQAAGQQRMQSLLILLPDKENVYPDIPEFDNGTIVTVVDESHRKKIEELFQLADIELGTHLFTIDPMGHLMMRHDTRVLTPKQVLADYKILLASTEQWVRKN